MTLGALSNLIPAVLAYFHGERQEMLSILGASAVVAAAVAALFLTMRDGFAKGLMITTLVCAAVLSASAVSLLARDRTLSQSIVSAMEGTAATTVVEKEQSRIAAVIANYPLYRWAAVLVGIVALLLLVLVRQHWLHGVAAGLLLLVVAQVVIDRYSEARAASYLEQISRLSKVRT